MPDVIKTLAFSFAQGADRTVENRMWNGFYAQNASYPMKLKAGQGVFDTMVMFGSVAEVFASAMTFRGIEDMVRPLPFRLGVPANLLRTPDVAIDSAEGFFSTLLADVYGIKPLKSITKNSGLVWIMVDPDLLPAATRQQIATQLTGQKVLIILREGIKVPAELISLSLEGNNEAFPTNAFAPFASPMTEEALLQKGGSQFVVIGAGQRLLSTMIGVADTILQNIENPDLTHKTSELRCEIMKQFLFYLPFGPGFEPWCVFDENWYRGATTLQEAVLDYLEHLGFEVGEAYPDEFNVLDNRSDFTIAPLWQPA